MLSSSGSLLTGVEASAAQNSSVTKTCSQCGAILPSSVRACSFCDSSLSVVHEERSISRSVERRSSPAPAPCFSDPRIIDSAAIVDALKRDSAWEGEVHRRVEAYRARRRKPSASTSQSHFAFEDSGRSQSCSDPRESSFISGSCSTVALEQTGLSQAVDDFSFTIAIGRNVATSESSSGRMEIDVSIPPEAETIPRAVRPASAALNSNSAISEALGLYPVASLEERRSAAFIDIACLFFAYGAFLALFSSLGGQFTLSKLSAAVYAVTASIVYFQYFALFTIFGGTTPGMIFRGLQVASFTGDQPTPRQMLLRSLGYVLSAGTLFLGFFWAWWDEDALTWHDRLSSTYLSPQQPDLVIDPAAAAPQTPAP